MITLNVFSIIILTGISSIAIAFPLLLLSKEKNKYIFAVYLLCIMVLLMSSLYYKSELFYEYPNLSMLDFHIVFLISPLMYLYIKFSLEGHELRMDHISIHLIPFLVSVVYMVPFYMHLSKTEKIYIITDVINITHHLLINKISSVVVTSLIAAQLLVYAFVSERLIIKTVNVSFQTKQRLKTFLYINVFISTVNFILRLLLQMSVLDIYIFWNISSLVTTLICFSMVMHGLFFSSFLTRYNKQRKYLPDDSFVERIFKLFLFPSCSNEQKLYLKKLDQLIIQEKLFTNDQISLRDLSARLQVTNNFLSNLINDHVGLNFSDFINRYRIEEAKKYIANINKNNMNILQIAHECGFSSKATFNRAFKKHTDRTPSGFKDKKFKKTSPPNTGVTQKKR